MNTGSTKEGSQSRDRGRKARKRKGLEWVNRFVFKNPVYIALATSEKAFKRELKKLRVPVGDAKFPSGTSLACVIELERAGGGRVALVCVTPRGKRSKAEMLGTIVHESVHVFQSICSYIGERNPSIEFEAYSIEGIVKTLLESYHDQTGDCLV